MMQLSYRNDFEGGGGNKVFTRGATSGWGLPQKKIFLHQIF
jgi:hypothetical protein